MIKRLAKSALFKNSALVTISRFSVSGLNFIFLVYLARLLSTDSFGYFSTWLTAINFVSTFLIMGLNVSLVYHSKEVAVGVENTFLTIKFVSIITFLLFTLITLFYLVSYQYGSGWFIFSASILAGSLGLAVLTLIASFFQSFEDFKSFAFVYPLPYLTVTTVVLYYFFSNQFGLNKTDAIFIYIFGIGIGLICSFFIFFMRAWDQIKIKIVTIASKEMPSKRFLVYGIKATALLLISQILYASDIFLLKIMRGATTVSFYFISVSISKISWLITDSIGNVIFPRMTKLNEDQKALSSFDSSIFKIFGLLFLITIAASVVFLIAGQEIITIFFGEQYSSANTNTLILIIASFGMSIYKIYSRKFAAINKWNEVYIALIGASLLNLILNYFLIPNMGAQGAAIASLISYWACGTYLLVRNSRLKETVI